MVIYFVIIIKTRNNLSIILFTAGCQLVWHWAVPLSLAEGSDGCKPSVPGAGMLKVKTLIVNRNLRSSRLRLAGSGLASPLLSPRDFLATPQSNP